MSADEVPQAGRPAGAASTAPGPELPLLEVRGLGVRRDGKSLLENVSLEVLPGALHLLVGPNGAGKSTLFSAILGLSDFTGSVRFHVRGSGRIGYVPQRFAFDRTLPLTVGEFLALPRQRWPVCLGLRARTRVRVAALLSKVSLGNLLERPIAALSGGELQRVLLANALDPAPELLLLDEPSSGLDELAARNFEETLLAVRRETGAAALMVSHDLAQALRIATRVTVLNRTVVRSGTPAELSAHPGPSLFL